MKKQAIAKLFHLVYGLYCRMTPLSKTAILFESSTGNNWTGSPRAIYEKMVELGLDRKYEIYISMKHPENAKVEGQAKLIKRRTFPYFRAFAKAGIWVTDSRMPLYLIKKDGVTCIQTWHGTPLKKLALDMDKLDMGGSVDLQKYQENFRRNTSRWDYLVSQNPYSTEIFRRCFDFHKEMLETGYPRCDVLFQKNTPEQVLELKKELGLPTDKKIILYAPTWRDDEYSQKGKYSYHDALDVDAMRQAFGGEAVLIIKYHYLVSSNTDWSKYEGFVYNFSQTADISPLYLVSDIMITDYSSVMFDYAILDRPMYFFCYDLEHYRDTLRGFYFDFEKTAPGPIVKTTRELVRAIQREKDSPDPVSLQRRAAFRRKFLPFDDGHASEKIVKLIEEIRS